MPILEQKSWRGGISDFEDRGIEGAFKFGSGLDIRKDTDSLSCNQALMEIGDLVTSASRSPSASTSPSASASSSRSASVSPSPSISPTSAPFSPSASKSPSPSRSPSASVSPSASLSPSNSTSPSPSPTFGGSSVFVDLVKYWVAASDGNTYGFGSTGKIYQVTPDLAVKQVYDAKAEIFGAEEAPTASKKKYLVWATNRELHRKELPGRVDWNDVDNSPGWPKSNLTGDVPHIMKTIGGAVNIANGDKLAYLGYDESFTNEALDLIPGNVINTIVERGQSAVFGVYRQGYEGKGVNGAIDTEIPLAQIGDDGELFYSTMSDFVMIKRFPGGGRVYPGGVSAEVSNVAFFEWDQMSLSYIDKNKISNLSVWGVFGATSGKSGIYSYGRKNKNHKIVLNLDYPLEVDEIGAVICNNNNTLISYRDGVTFGCKAIDPNQKTQGICDSLDFKTPIKPITKITEWTLAELFMEPLPSGCSIAYYYKTDKTGDWKLAKTSDNQTAFSAANAKKAVFSLNTTGEIIERRIVLNPSGNNTPEILRERVYFK